MPDPLVLFSQSELDVDGCEKCEDEGLKYGDQQFEQREDEAEREGADSEERVKTAGREQEELGGREAQHQKHVSGDHVHQKSKGKRDGPQDERRQ